MAKHEKSEAAEKIAKAAKEKTSAPKAKKDGNIFQRMGKAIAKFCKDFKGEIKKITWPNGKMVLKSTLVVLASIAIIGVVVFLVDLGLSKGVKGLKSLGEKYQESQTTTQAAEEETSAAADAATQAVTQAVDLTSAAAE